MFFIGYENNGKYGVVDTDDGVIECVSAEDLNRYKKSGIVISSWSEVKSVLSNNVVRSSSYSFWRLVAKHVNSVEIDEFLSTKVVYAFINAAESYGSRLDLSKDIKVYSYNETDGYIIVIISLCDGRPMVIKLDSDFNVRTEVLPAGFHTKSYPSCSGDLIIRLAMKHGVPLDGVVRTKVYLVLYSYAGNELLLVDQSSIGLGHAIGHFAIPVGVVLK